MIDLVLTLIGPDRPGLVEAVAAVIAENGGNWLESRMAHLTGKFAGILRVEIPDGKRDLVTTALGALQERGLRVVVEPSDGGANAPESSRIMELELVGLDRPGIVREISQILARSGANVEDLSTNRSSAPMSGEMLFSAKTRIQVPPMADVAKMRAELERMASDLMVEIRLVETSLEAKGRNRPL